jgi:hypothetical protein
LRLNPIEKLMSDPFAPNPHDQLMREAQRGFLIIAVLLAILAYFCFDRIFGRGNRLPQHVRDAPVAQTVWPYSQDRPDPAGRIADRQRANELPFAENPALVSAGLKHRRANAETESSGVQPKFDGSDPVNQNDSAIEANSLQQASVHVDIAQSKAVLDANYRPIPSIAKDSNPAATSTELNQPCNFEKPNNGFLTSHHLGKVRPNQHDAETRPFQAAPYAGTNDFQPIFSSTQNSRQAKPPQPTPRLTQLDSGGENPAQVRPLDPFETKPEASSLPVPQTKRDIKVPIDFRSAPVLNSGLATDESNHSKTPQHNSFAEKTSAGTTPVLNAPQPISVPPASVENPNLTGNGDSNPLSQVGLSSERVGAGENLNDGTRIHVVKKDESYYSISQQYYGDGNYFRALHRHNVDTRSAGDVLAEGSQLEIPSLHQLIASYPAELPFQLVNVARALTYTNSSSTTSHGFKTGDNRHHLQQTQARTRIYLTREGESVFDIAANELGQASRYLEILELNADNLPSGVTSSTPLQANLTLDLPVFEN